MNTKELLDRIHASISVIESDNEDLRNHVNELGKNLREQLAFEGKSDMKINLHDLMFQCLYDSKNKIQQIKLVRMILGCGLRDAKEMVEAVHRAVVTHENADEDKGTPLVIDGVEYRFVKKQVSWGASPIDGSL